MQINKIPVTTADEQFLFALYAETRHEEMSLVNWDEEQKLAFLYQQFQAQHNYYTSKFPTADFLILSIDGENVGRLYTAEFDDEIRILDLTIASVKRGQGLGTELIAEIVKKGRQENKSIQIYLETTGRSASIFSRFGFKPVSGDEIYQLWQLDLNDEKSGSSSTEPETNQATA